MKKKKNWKPGRPLGQRPGPLHLSGCLAHSWCVKLDGLATGRYEIAQLCVFIVMCLSHQEEVML